ncbi:MAG TPA: bifunctional phosphopantothenoylcysteine decarboxylase/phosphopantothenate--cysteine ligase CoaBC [Coleofasciculaceae cyanobacterium]|jgi:phosphopantothenoylcysteine decarboxylase/phosphopantothenate--cysteine ligase
MDFSGKTIVIGVTGGIAAYKACDLIRELYRRQAARVLCVMTSSAQNFITPLTLQALSREPVYTSELAVDDSGTPLHITLAQQADALLILPATADTVAKLAAGFADNMVTTTAITFTGKPILLAPAMNTRMWENPLTRENLDKLRQLPNFTVIEPKSGHLACGETGEGHLADQESILQALYQAVHPQMGLFKGIKAVVTAGGTTEPIDPVRVISNRSSGKMGLALADELFAMGADVTLVTTRPPGPRPYSIVAVQTATEMQQALDSRFEKTNLLLMAAAVSDFAVENPAEQKIKRENQPEPQINLVSNPDILAELGQRKRPGQVLVGFAAESGNLIKNAEDKLRRKQVDAIVANDISQEGIGIGADENEVTLLFPGQPPQPLPRASKGEVARQLLRVIHDRLLKLPSERIQQPITTP